MASFSSIITKVDSSEQNVMLLAESFNRSMVTIYNNSKSVLYIKYGIGATVDSFTLKIHSGDYLELPFPCYTGRIDGFWETVNGNAMITEIAN